MADNVIQAAHLFKREPTPEEQRSKFWEWGEKWVDEGINNLEYIFEEVQGATSEADLHRALTDLRDEIESYPIDD
jgi:hypothetical protein